MSRQLRTGVEDHETNLLVLIQFEQNQSLSCCGSSSTSAHSLFKNEESEVQIDIQ